MNSTYADTLKQLIGLADIKLFIVANTLGYDISYISKWCNGAKLPSGMPRGVEPNLQKRLVRDAGQWWLCSDNLNKARSSEQAMG